VAQLKENKLKQEERINQLDQELKNAKALNDKFKEHAVRKDENIEKLKSALEEAGNRLRQFQGIVAEKDTDITNLQTRMAALTSENEQKEIWKHQMEEYKSNFEDERRDRMAMRERLELLTQELAEAQEQLKKKTADLEALHGTHLQLANEHLNRDEDASVSRGSAPPTGEYVFVPPQNIGAAAGGGTSYGSSSPPPSFPTLGPQTPPPCPLCSKKFKSVASLERHAANCGIEAAATRTDPFVFP